MWAAAAIDVAGGIFERSAKRLRRNCDVEVQSLESHNSWLAPGVAAVEGAIENDGVCEVIVPCHIQFAVGAHKRHSSDGFAWPRRVIGARDREGGAMIGGSGDANSTCGGTSAGRIPGDINIVAKWAAWIHIGSNHWFVIEVIAATGEAEIGGRGKTFSAIGRLGDRQFAAIYAVASTKKDNNVAIEQVS